MARLTFYGAAETVTGSKYLLEAGSAKVLIDCGLFQGLKELRERNWQKLPFDPASVQAVVLTHAHIDHLGYLPRFVKDGFRGPVYATPPTQRLARTMLLDAAHNQEEDAEYLNRKDRSKHKPALPLFDARDAEASLRLLRAQPRSEWFSPAAPIWMRYHDVGHLLGAAMIEVEIRTGARPLRILFSGDVGRYAAPLYHDPQPPPACDYFICESTYGDREHPEEAVLDELCKLTQGAIARGGVMLVAAFAVGRSQQLIYLLQVLFQQGRLPRLPIYLDSPMASDATAIFKAFAADHDLSEGSPAGLTSALEANNVHLTRSVDESKAINAVQGPAVIISSSGMMTGGRILHHLKKRAPQPQNTIVLGGFMAAGTRGRQLQEGIKWVRIHGHDVPIKAAVERMSALSGHADHAELLRWVKDLPAPRQTFLTHGEPPSAAFFADELRRLRGWNVHVPRLGDSVELPEI